MIEALGRRGVMLHRRVCSCATAALLVCSAPLSAAEPLTPVDPWVVDYQPTTCTASRAYGSREDAVTLGLEPSVWGDTYDLVVVKKGRGPEHPEESEGWLDFGQGPIKAWLLHYGVEKSSKLSFFRFRISAAEMAQANSASQATFRFGIAPDLSFSLAQIPALMKTLAACTADLRHYWNMVDPEQRNIAAPAIGDVRSVFRPSDYPAEAIARHQGGRVQFLLLVNEEGKVAKCSILSPSGIPVLDGMGCQVIRERAVFKPALDRNGKPARSAVTTPPVVWRLAS